MKKLLKGNEAIAEAAIQAGCRFFFGLLRFGLRLLGFGVVRTAFDTELIGIVGGGMTAFGADLHASAIEP